MITTIDIKAHLHDVFEIGSPSASHLETVLILGSCRTVPYLNYLNRFNPSRSRPFRIFAIEPNNYHWNSNDQPVGIEDILTGLETNERILSIIHSTGIFIHEHYAHFQMFNTSRDEPKNIYQFGMEAWMDISVPNFHDHFILENDYGSCGLPVPDNYIERGEYEIEKFCSVCELSSFPEFGDYFRNNWRETRFFWRPNHVSAKFTLKIFELMNDKFLHLPLNEEFWNGAIDEDLFKNPHTEVTQRDIDGYNLKWK